MIAIAIRVRYLLVSSIFYLANFNGRALSSPGSLYAGGRVPPVPRTPPATLSHSCRSGAGSKTVSDENERPWARVHRSRRARVLPGRAVPASRLSCSRAASEGPRSAAWRPDLRDRGVEGPPFARDRLGALRRQP